MNSQKSTFEIIREAFRFPIGKFTVLSIITWVFRLIATAVAVFVAHFITSAVITPLVYELLKTFIEAESTLGNIAASVTIIAFAIITALLTPIIYIFAIGPFEVGVKAYIINKDSSFSVFFSTYKDWVNITKLKLSVYVNQLIYSLIFFGIALVFTILISLLMLVCQLHDLLTAFIIIAWVCASVLSIVRSYSYIFTDCIYFEKNYSSANGIIKRSDYLINGHKGRHFLVTFSLVAIPALCVLIVYLVEMILIGIFLLLGLLGISFGTVAAVALFDHTILILLIVAAITLIPSAIIAESISHLASVILYNELNVK